MKISELLKQYKEQQKQKRKLSFKHFAEDEIQIREFEGEYYFAFRGIPLFRVDTFSKYDLNNSKSKSFPIVSLNIFLTCFSLHPIMSYSKCSGIL